MSLLNKIRYTIDSVDDIQRALEERGFDMDNLPLGVYGDKIREIKSSNATPIIRSMSLMSILDIPNIVSHDDMFSINQSVYIKDKICSIQSHDKEVIAINNDLFRINQTNNIIRDILLATEEV